MSKKHRFLSKNESFWAKKYQNSCKNQYEKSLILVKCSKSTFFYQCRIWLKKVEKLLFSCIFMNFHPCIWTKDKIMLIFYMRKTGKNYVKKHVKNGKSGNFQKVLKSSIRLQITFWIAEKIAIECFNPNPKYEENP